MLLANKEYIEVGIKETILSSLNEQQKEAAINFEGPCIINAGPGAGKDM